jgi:hypothetical protein
MTDSVNQAPGVENSEGEHPLPEGESVPPKPEEASGEAPEEKKPASEYDIVASKRLEPESNFASDHYQPDTAAAGAQGQGSQGQNAAGKQADPKARLSDASIEQIGKFASSQTRVYAVIGVGLGLLVGLIAAAILLHPGSPGGPNDMGTVNANEYGLKGHLTTDWKDKLEYHLTVEPSAPEQRTGFLADVSSSPRPLSIAVQVKDPFGAVLCGDTILLKYDPRNAPGNAPAELGPKAAGNATGRIARAAKERAARDAIAQGINLARLEGEELDREHGKNIFQDDVAPNGQIASISTQGILPCTKKQFDSIASWGLTADFPIVVQPVKSEESSPDSGANGESSTGDGASGMTSGAKKLSNAAKAKRRPLPPAPPIYIEGDDAIVYIDAANGIIETSAGKALVLDKTDPVVSALKGRDFPISIHYRCDQLGACTFAAIGMAGDHRAKLKR